jgi:DNA polymerase
MREVTACRPWLDAEIAAIKPRLIVCLGATAAQALLGSYFRVIESRGRVLELAGYPPIVATVHPSSILRAQSNEDRHQERQAFINDLKVAAEF